MGVSEKPYSGQMDAEKWVVAVVPPWRDLKPVFTKPVDSKAEKQEEELSTTPTSEESRIPSLLYLDLSRNNLSGPVPAYFGEIHLQYLNLSYNDFKGIVPTKGVFMNASATSVMGNSKLCGGISDLHLPLCKAKLLEKSKSSVRLKLIISTAFGLLGTTILCILLLVFCFRKRNEPTMHSPNGSMLRLSYQSLIKAT
ncbi:hypothetical protein RJ640_001951 [Escallonia rubra]|uniref:Uncharacterized protein n=1 Tax=Escallonia rubra TaxID=112253 RepID=A0AA88UIE4_9ASTE|nr:hypothetical protein RJ640_001951 [Escallonia rubra]